LEDVGNAVSSAFEAVAEVVQQSVETASDVATDVIETAGSAILDGLTAVGGEGGAWLGGAVAGVANLIGAAIKLVSGIVSGGVGGAIRIIGGLLSWDADLILEGLVDIFTGVVGGVTYLLGTVLAAFQRLTLLQNTERPLTKAEREMIRRIFFNSISLYNIRIVEGRAGAFDVHPGANTLGNTIYMKDIDTGSLRGRSILVHECVHVWQYQNHGSAYTADALGAQFLMPNPYIWENEVARGRSEWTDFNKEAQAEMIEEVWLWGTLTYNGNTSRGLGCFFDLQDVQSRFGNGSAEFIYTGTDDDHIPRHEPIDYTELAARAVESIRGRINLRWSRDL